jgi:AbrB family looped-hinge helix DNA binding protein
LAIQLTLAKVGRRGSLTIPSAEREKAHIKEGDHVEVQASSAGLLTVKKVPNITEVRKRLSGKLPQWPELEGKADELLKKDT